MLFQKSLLAAAVVLAASIAGAASAQTDQPPPASPQTPGLITQGGPSATGSAVVRPPAGIDPGMSKMPPGTGRTAFPTPVVPPPGAPGGNPDVVPK